MRFSLTAAAAAALGLAFLAASCSGKAGKPATGTPPGAKKTVYADNYPVAYFAERIAGGLVPVVFPAPKDGDPAFWEPSESAVQEYQKADLILQNGAGFAKWADKVSLPAERIVDTSLPFKDRWLKIVDAVTHSHGPAGKHSHEGTDFNTWTDPELASSQAGEVAKALAKLSPEHRETFEKNLAALRADLDALDAGFKAL
ncbi:MAG: metal ABC transporter substrate-binding protein, partial [Planctomycetes bacterium]|nr:metal ABC transporter substrate-binding protein [Planctomycetota bacterium]